MHAPPRPTLNPVPLLAASIPVAAFAHLLLAGPGGAAHLAIDAHDAVRLLLRYALLLGVGAMGLLLGAGHVLAPERTAAHIGWAPHAPFQFELGIANWGFAVPGVCAFWGPWAFQAAAVLGFAVFYWGCAWLHWRELLHADNRAPGNAGFMLWWDTLFPLALAVLLWASR